MSTSIRSKSPWLDTLSRIHIFLHNIRMKDVSPMYFKTLILASIIIYLSLDIRIGRNLARAFLEYYRFTNVLPIPPLKELLLAKKRPKTHKNRAYRSKPEYKPRPRTTRPSAPINYFDLGIDYDSGSDDGSPVRYPFHSYLSSTRLKPLPLPAGQQQQVNDQFSLMTIKNAKFDQLDFKPGNKSLTQHAVAPLPPVPRPVLETKTTKPHLSIIDVNMLTRGSLEEAKTKLQPQQSIGKNRK